MGLADRNNPKSFEEMAKNMEDDLQPSVKVKVKKKNWIQRLFSKRTDAHFIVTHSK